MKHIPYSGHGQGWSRKKKQAIRALELENTDFSLSDHRTQNGSIKGINLKFSKYRIQRFDDRNLVVERRQRVRKRSGTTSEEWVWHGYHSNLRHALLAVADDLLTSESQTAQQILTEISRLREWLEENIPTASNPTPTQVIPEKNAVGP